MKNNFFIFCSYIVVASFCMKTLPTNHCEEQIVSICFVRSQDRGAREREREICKNRMNAFLSFRELRPNPIPSLFCVQIFRIPIEEKLHSLFQDIEQFEKIQTVNVYEIDHVSTLYIFIFQNNIWIRIASKIYYFNRNLMFSKN